MCSHPVLLNGPHIVEKSKREDLTPCHLRLLDAAVRLQFLHEANQRQRDLVE
jgi:hypothetical protein